MFLAIRVSAENMYFLVSAHCRSLSGLQKCSLSSFVPPSQLSWSRRNTYYLLCPRSPALVRGPDLLPHELHSVDAATVL